MFFLNWMLQAIPIILANRWYTEGNIQTYTWWYRRLWSVIIALCTVPVIKWQSNVVSYFLSPYPEWSRYITLQCLCTRSLFLWFGISPMYFRMTLPGPSALNNMGKSIIRIGVSMPYTRKTMCTDFGAYKYRYGLTCCLLVVYMHCLCSQNNMKAT